MSRSRAPIRIRCVTPQLIHEDEFIGRIVDALNYLRMEVKKNEDRANIQNITEKNVCAGKACTPTKFLPCL